MSSSTRPEAVRCNGAPVSVSCVPDGFDQSYPDAALIAQAITGSLFSAGYDLCFVLGMTSDGPGRTRLEHAVSEVDGAIRDLRHLMLTLWEHAHDAPRDFGAADGS
jgi:hypothetical protein